MAEATVEISQPVQITITPRSSDISTIGGMWEKKNQVSLAGFQLGESSPVSECSVRVTQLNRITHTDHFCCGGDLEMAWGGFVQACNVPQITVPVSEPRKKCKENKMGNGKKWAIFICKLCTDVLHFGEAPRLLPLFCVKQILYIPQE